MNARLSPAPLSGNALPASRLPHATELAHSVAPDHTVTVLRGPSESMGRLWHQASTVAPHFRTLLLTGERGCGAETVAHLLHSLSPFRTGTFLSLDPASAQRRLRSPKRLLREVTGGVLYLSDVDQLGAEAQDDLQRFMRLNRLHPCALIAFTSGDLRSLAATGEFPPALAESLRSFRMQIPSLRERREDIPLLAESLLREACTASDALVPTLAPSFVEEASHLDWPENVDELRSVMSRLASMPHTGTLEASDLQSALEQLRQAPPPAHNSPVVRMVKLDLVMQEHIRSVLIACQGNKLRASEILGISRSTLYRMLESGSSQSMALLA